jgi:hypothetical protein
MEAWEMTRALVYIVQRDSGWIIKLNGKEFGPAESSELAVDVTMRAAARMHDRGCPVHIMVHDGSRFRTVWLDGQLLPVQAA